MCKESVSINSDVMASKYVHSMSLESVNNSHSTTSIRASSVYLFFCFDSVPVTRTYESARAFRSAGLALR